YDAEGDDQSSWEMQLLDEFEALVETQVGTGTSTTDAFTTVVPDSSTWPVRLRLRDGSGMWSEWGDATVTVDYPEPMQPLVAAVWDPGAGGVSVNVDNPPPAGLEPEVIYNDVYRSINGGEWVLVATQLPANSSFTDYEAASVGTNSYRATAWSELPSASESEPIDLLI